MMLAAHGIPWRVQVLLHGLAKRRRLLAANLRCRRPLRRPGALRYLRRMIDPARINPGSIPVVINNFNRYASLRLLVEWLLTNVQGDASIIILDNASSYPPLLDFYGRLVALPWVQIVRLGYNSGLEGIQDVSRELRRFPKYVITDPDLVPYPDTPSDILLRMSDLLDRFPDYSHVGASMEIRDIPETYPLRAEVVEWESRYWPPCAPACGDGVFDAWVDTTFAMYRNTSNTAAVHPALRMDRPYTLKHVDWYIDPDALSDEQEYYLRTCGRSASWTTKLLSGNLHARKE